MTPQEQRFIRLEVKKDGLYHQRLALRERIDGLRSHLQRREQTIALNVLHYQDPRYEGSLQHKNDMQEVSDLRTELDLLQSEIEALDNRLTPMTELVARCKDWLRDQKNAALRDAPLGKSQVPSIPVSHPSDVWAFQNIRLSRVSDWVSNMVDGFGADRK